jgi:N-acetylneuraminic acid mutarotase
MSTARYLHSATLLSNGKVLVAGGMTGSTVLASAELYDPGTGKFTLTGSMQVPRLQHLAVLLPSGKVLVAGGTTYGNGPNGYGLTATAETYDPKTGLWTLVPSMAYAHGSGTSTLLANGKVLVASGCTNYYPCNLSTAAEFYDSSSNAWTPAGNLNSASTQHTATLLLSGKVLVAGGYNPDTPQILSRSELYDPASGAWTNAASLNGIRMTHAATLLSDGKVVVEGNANGYIIQTSEIYDPVPGTWSLTGNYPIVFAYAQAVLLQNGKVLSAAGLQRRNTRSFGTTTTALWTESTGTWTTTGSLTNGRYYHTLTLLKNGKALAVGGWTATGPTAATEIYTP